MAQDVTLSELLDFDRGSDIEWGLKTPQTIRSILSWELFLVKGVLKSNGLFCYYAILLLCQLQFKRHVWCLNSGELGWEAAVLLCNIKSTCLYGIHFSMKMDKILASGFFRYCFWIRDVLLLIFIACSMPSGTRKYVSKCLWDHLKTNHGLGWVCDILGVDC